MNAPQSSQFVLAKLVKDSTMMERKVGRSGSGCSTDQNQDGQDTPRKTPAASGESLSTKGIKDLRADDVLCGRGPGLSHFEGNLRFRKLCDDRKNRYISTQRRKEKGEIAAEVVNIVHKNGGRFLKQHGSLNFDDDWFEVDDDVAIEKAKQSLREIRESTSSTPSDSDRKEGRPLDEAPTSCSSSNSNSDHKQSTLMPTDNVASRSEPIGSPGPSHPVEPSPVFSCGAIPAVSQSMAEHVSGTSVFGTKPPSPSTSSVAAISAPAVAPPPKNVSNAGTIHSLPPDPRLLLFQGTQLGSPQQQPMMTQAVWMNQFPQFQSGNSPLNATVSHSTDQTEILQQLVHSTNAAAAASHQRYVADNTMYSLLRNFALLQQQQQQQQQTGQLGASLNPQQVTAPEAITSNEVRNFDTCNAMKAEEGSVDKTNIPMNEASSSEERRLSDVSIDEELSAFLLSSLAVTDRPVVTEEQEEAERRSLTDEEKATLLTETFGRMCDDDDPRVKRARVDLPRRDVEFLIKQMRIEIDKIPMDQKRALSEAQLSMACHRDEFSDDRLEKFLRCERFNVKMAALRYALYWECRKEVFGEKYLMRMTLSEALKDDSVALGIGMYTILPHRDVSGRLVLYMEPGRHSRDGYTSESLLRAVWYVAEVAALENNNATSGVVNVVFFKGSTIWDYDKVFDRWAYFLSSCWPIRLIANHLCCAPTMILRLAKPIIHSFVSKEFRARTLAHSASESDIPQALWKYGIHQLPTQMGGNVILDQEDWIADRRAAELEEIL